MNLSEKEKAAVAQFLSEDVGFAGILSMTWPYLLPLLFAAGYGVFTYDIIAISMSFLFIFMLIFWYLYHSGKSGKVLQSALRKYEDEVNRNNL